MLCFVAQVARRARVRYAIGGGVAVAARGFRRDTMDVDAFFHYADRQKVLRAANRVGRSFDIEKLDESHWIAVPEGAEPDERVDLLFATGDPEESAIEMASPARYGSATAQMFTVEWLAVVKFLSDRGDPKDALDVWALYQRGGFDPRDVARRLRQMGLREEAREFPEFLARIEALVVRRRRR